LRYPSRFGDLVVSRTKGALIEGIEQLGLERIVAVHLKGGALPEAAMTLFVEMLGPAGNFILVDRATGTIVDRLRSSSGRARRETPGAGAPYRPPFDRGRIDPRVVGEDEFRRLVRARLAEGMGPARALMTCFTGFGPLIAEELVARSGLSPHFSPDDRTLALWKPFCDLISRITRGRFEPRLLVGDDGQPVGMAAFPLVTLPADRQVPYPTMSAAAAAYHSGREVAAGQEALRAGLLRSLNREIAAAKRLSARLADEVALYSQADLHGRKGKLLLSNRAAIRRGQRVVELPDYADPAQGVVHIELDPARSIEENARRYFALQRKAKRGAEVVGRRLADVADRLTRLRGLVREAEAAKGSGELQRVDAALTPMARRAPRRERAATAARESEGPEPRRFRSSDGLPILVGRSGAGNDRLTWRLARSHDLWLHAQGIPGSHVLVRLEKGKQAPPRTLLEAAQIAAYYSRARGRVKVPVDYALRKYLRKPRAAAPGAVLLTQEKTIAVRPDRDLVRRLHPGRTHLRTEG
jgi:predicted ribosome quality control (RQC) complex YloA/Tae2 family protein